MYHFQTTHLEVVLSYIVLLIYEVTLSDPYSATTQFGGVTDWYQSQTVTYTSVYFDSEPWRFQWVSDDEPQSPEAAPQLPEQAPPSPDYVPGPEHPPSPNYVPGPEYPEYVVPSDDEVPIEDQPLPADASPIALSLGYVADSDPKEDPDEDPKKDPKKDPANYPVDGEDDEEEEEESSVDDDDEEEKEEATEDDEEEEEEHLALANSTTATPPPPPRSPQTKVSFSQTRLYKARKTVRHQPPMAASTGALIAEFASAPTPPSPPPSPLSHWSSPLPQIPSPPLLVLSPPLPLPSPPTHTSPTYTKAPLGYKVTMIQMRDASPPPAPSPPLLLPSADHRSDIPETGMSFQKRLCLTAFAYRFEVGESSTAAAARQT
ncbi:hypothetical protein Tco_1450280 [Tanacetum coccineum]